MVSVHEYRKGTLSITSIILQHSPFPSDTLLSCNEHSLRFFRGSGEKLAHISLMAASNLDDDEVSMASKVLFHKSPENLNQIETWAIT